MDENEIIETIPETPQPEPPRRRRGRPRKVNPETLITVEGEEETKPKRTRRATKMKGSDVTNMLVKGSGYYASLSGRDYWNISAAEVEPWADDAAELLNKLPSRYVRAAVDFSGYIAVGIGIFSVFAPRIAMDRAFAAQAKANKERSEQPGTVASVETRPNGAANPTESSVWGPGD